MHHSAHAGLAAQDNDDFSGLFVKNELSEKTDFNIERTATLNDRTISIASSYDMSSLQQTGILLPVESNFINTCSTPEASSPATKMKVCQRPKYRPSPPWLPHTTDIAYCSDWNSEAKEHDTMGVLPECFKLELKHPVKTGVSRRLPTVGKLTFPKTQTELFYFDIILDLKTSLSVLPVNLALKGNF